MQATIVLHNYLQSSEIDLLPENRKYCPTGFTDITNNDEEILGAWRDDNVLSSVGRLASNNASKVSQENRDKLAQYFLSSEGALSWQNDYVRRGNATQ